jgi:hypothetical protein
MPVASLRADIVPTLFERSWHSILDSRNDLSFIVFIFVLIFTRI